jgi:hypothetical protein
MTTEKGLSVSNCLAVAIARVNCTSITDVNCFCVKSAFHYFSVKSLSLNGIFFKSEFPRRNCWLHLVELSLGNFNRRATSSAVLQTRLWITIAYIPFRYIYPDLNILLFICGVICVSNHVEDVKWGVASCVLSVTNFLDWFCSDSVGCYMIYLAHMQFGVKIRSSTNFPIDIHIFLYL